MNLLRFWRDSLIAVLSLAALQAFQASLLKEALMRQEILSMHRLQASVAGVLNKAHESKDDLAILLVMNALAQGPGIIQARIENTESAVKIPRQQGAYVYVLRNGEQKWGRLILSVSDRFRQELVRRQWLAGAAAAGLLWIGLFVYIQFSEKKISSLRTQASELGGLLQSEKRKLMQAQEREQKAAVQASACLQKAIQHISVPVIILDVQQKLSAVNDSALSHLGLAVPNDVLGKSWQDIPILSGCGAALEQSLASPGQRVQWIASEGDIPLTFETDRDKLSGTWIFL